MTEARSNPRPGSNRARRQVAAARARRRMRWGYAAAGVALLLIGGLVLGLHYANRPAAASGAPSIPSPGQPAPAGTFTTLTGRTVNVADLVGRPTLVWFVSTWCSSCQAGTETMAENLAKLRADGVRVDEVELYRDLGQSGPSMGTFARTLAGSQYGNPAWTFGVSSSGLTRTYDPQSYLDIYYLLDAAGRITYVNSSPGSTMPQLLAAAKGLA